jgi:hypothetical protein
VNGENVYLFLKSIKEIHKKLLNESDEWVLIDKGLAKRVLSDTSSSTWAGFYSFCGIP